jgi:Zn-dependent peptidase ImmA (M78 family)/predicted secreted protein
VTSWAQANRSAVVMASEIHGDLKIDLDRPVDVFAAIQELGIVLAFRPLGKVSGVYVPGKPASGILLHEGHPRTRQRYSAGHELGHHVFGHTAEIDLEPEQGLERAATERWPAHEKEAEAFAAWFLMPRRLLRSGLEHLGIGDPKDPYDVYALSLWLGTSYTATARQLAVTRLVDRRLADEWSSIPPANLKKALAGEMVPNDLRNDVWWLDARHHMQPVDARPGDRLVLTLPEIPSSGFSWHFTSMPAQMHLLSDSYSDHWEPDFGAGRRGEDPHEPDPETAGSGSDRSFALEVSAEAHLGVEHLALVKERSWEKGRGNEEFELLISVATPLRGIQLSEEELALPGGGRGAA